MPKFSDGVYQYGGQPMGIPPFASRNSKTFWVDPVYGADGNPGDSPKRALKTLYRAHQKMTAGQNDVCFLIGNGASTGTARLSTALATGIPNGSLTTGELIWSKNACHLIGVAAPGLNSRARIATPTGTYTAATFGSNTMMTVSGSGCYFANISLTQSFSTGNAAEISLVVSGDYNSFDNVFVSGPLSAAGYGGANSRALKIDGGDENLFRNCFIGTDTVTRSAANANLQLASGAARNQFIDCTFAMYTSSASSLFVLVAAAAGCDRFTLFKDCVFANAMDSGSTALTGAMSLAASAGGCMIVKNCALVGDGNANWGADAASLAQIYVEGGTPAAATTGLAVNPS